MTLSPALYTATMARLFAEQGYCRKAAQIYRALLLKAPERDDLRHALEELERRMAEQPTPSRKDTEMMLRDWAEMLKQTHSRARDKRAG
jgi:hypothetical protein